MTAPSQLSFMYCPWTNLKNEEKGSQKKKPQSKGLISINGRARGGSYGVLCADIRHGQYTPLG